ncbi:MAG TPA: ABC transporter ATP-binding protein [Chloroflexia bacterium]|nr:ABC transporter ATP-binding protein [Chloroflexia bacterium]
MQHVDLAVGPAAIHITGLDKEFPARWRPLKPPAPPTVALSAFALTVPTGQRLAILGPNGAGKSTLLRILATLIRPTRGEVTVQGVDIRDALAVCRQIGWATGDDRAFYWRLSGQANLEFFAALHDLYGAAARARIAAVLEQVGLADKAGAPYQAYSSGMRQRLAIARALLHEPAILLLDEPTRSLDPESADGIRRLLHSQPGAGHTLIWVTHNPVEAATYCDRVIWMRAGRVAADLSTSDPARAMAIPWQESG